MVLKWSGGLIQMWKLVSWGEFKELPHKILLHIWRGLTFDWFVNWYQNQNWWYIAQGTCQYLIFMHLHFYTWKRAVSMWNKPHKYISHHHAQPKCFSYGTKSVIFMNCLSSFDQSFMTYVLVCYSACLSLNCKALSRL